MLNAMRKQKLNKKIHLVGFDSSEPLLQAVREGDIDGLIVQDPYRMGYLGVWTLVKHLKGYAVESEHEQLGTGEDYLTKDNIDSDEMKGKFSPEFQAKRHRRAAGVSEEVREPRARGVSEGRAARFHITACPWLTPRARGSSGISPGGFA